MNRSTASIFSAIFKAVRPWSILAGLLLYALGGGIASYLGDLTDWPVLFIGLAAVISLLLSSFLLREYFDRAGQPPFEIPAPKPDQNLISPDQAEGTGEVRSVEIPAPRAVFLQLAYATLAIGAMLTVLLYAEHKLNPPAFLFLGLIFVLALAYAVPPFRLVYSGYGELVIAILVANLFPALAYLLQTGELHRLLAMLTFPLTLVYLAGALARSLQHYMEDIRLNRQTMLVRLGWQRGMSLHNILIVLAYIVLSISVIVGLPTRLAFPAFLSLPVAIFQIWQMNAIAGGAKPRWRILAYTALATVGFMAYFINLALWTG